MRYVNGYTNAEQTERKQWPAASMTWGERRLFAEGLTVHRDASDMHISAGSTLFPALPRSRQDAPAGSGGLLLHSPKGLEESQRRTFGFTAMSATAASSAHWEPLRLSRSGDIRSGISGGA